MVSKTSITAAVRAFDWQRVDRELAERPDLLDHRDDKGRNWLHLCCATSGGDPQEAIRTADVLIGLGLTLEHAAFTEGSWRATPLWFAIAHGRHLELAAHLLSLGSSPLYCLFAAVWNNDEAAIDLLLSFGALIDESMADGETPLLGAVGWSRFPMAEVLLENGANPNARKVNGDTAFHMMLRKNSEVVHLQMFAYFGAHGDIPDAEGRTAIDLLRRKRDPEFRALAEELSGAQT